MFTALSRRSIPVATLASLSLLASGTPLGAQAAVAATNSYPSTYEKAFVSTCAKTATAAAGKKLTKKQATAYCKSALTCIEKRLTFKQFKETVARTQSGKSNPNVKIFTSCGKAAVKKLS